MKKSILTCAITVVWITISIICVNGQEDSKTLPDLVIERSELSQEEQAKYTKQLEYQITEFDDSVYGKCWVHNIDVSQSGMIALAFDNNSIVIANQNFQNAYSISFSTVSPYNVNWNGENLELHLSKSDLIYTFSEDGQLIEVSKAIINSHLKLNKTADTVNGTTYCLKASNATMLLTGHRDKVVKIDSLGNEEVLFQSENSIPIYFILGFVIFIIGLLFFAIYIPLGIVRMKKQGKRYTFE